jgi:hypothetical protein
MFDHDPTSDAATAVARLAAVVDELQGLNLTSYTDENVLALVREVEVQKNRLASVDHAVLGELEARGVAGKHACASTTVLLTQVLRIHPGEADARVRAARDLGTRRALSGALLPPVFEQVAASSAAGRITPRHAAIITTTVSSLPAAIKTEHEHSVEQFLLEQAEQLGPMPLAKLAQRITATLNQDGALCDEADRRRWRELTLRQRPDGSSRVSGELDAITTEAVLTVLDTLARPTPTDQAGEPDPRSPGQRRHDALRDAMLTLLRSGELPACGGVAATILITISAEQLESRQGLVTTGHGAQISVGQAMTLAGDAQVQLVALDSGIDSAIDTALGTMKAITAYSSTHRIFTQGQRLAMIARDQGCSFPGCTVPPAWCEAHHITDYKITRHTRVDDGTLLCGYHHREHPRLAWTCRMLNGIPHWIAPTWIDPNQTPQRNQAHNPANNLVPV